jgi:hypothetical protein
LQIHVLHGSSIGLRHRGCKFYKRKPAVESFECGNRLLLKYSGESRAHGMKSEQSTAMVFDPETGFVLLAQRIIAAQTGTSTTLLPIEIYITSRQSPLLTANHIDAGRRHRSLMTSEVFHFDRERRSTL